MDDGGVYIDDYAHKSGYITSVVDIPNPSTSTSSFPPAEKPGTDREGTPQRATVRNSS
jgi:hypothetical protein